MQHLSFGFTNSKFGIDKSKFGIDNSEFSSLKENLENAFPNSENTFPNLIFPKHHSVSQKQIVKTVFRILFAEREFGKAAFSFSFAENNLELGKVNSESSFSDSLLRKRIRNGSFQI